MTTTNEVRAIYTAPSSGLFDELGVKRTLEISDGLGAEFDRWLAENNRKVAEAAWNEGHNTPQYKTNLNGDYLGKYKNPHTPND